MNSRLWLLLVLHVVTEWVEPNTQVGFIPNSKRISFALTKTQPEFPLAIAIESTRIIEPTHDDVWRFGNMKACEDLWDLTPEERVKLQNLKLKLFNIDHPKNNPNEVIRCLKEYKGNEQACEKAFRKMIDWRNETNADKLLEEYSPPSLYNYFPAGIIKGVDLDGDPIHIERTGAADSVGLLKRYGKEEMIKYAIWLREIQSNGEWHKEYELQQGHPVKEFTVIMDMDGLSMNQLNPNLVSIGQEVARIVQEYYPGYVKRFIFIRCPPIFHFALNFFKSFLDERMKEKITVLDKNRYCEELKQYLDPAILPATICPDGHGEAIDELNPIWGGGKIPNDK